MNLNVHSNIVSVKRPILINHINSNDKIHRPLQKSCTSKYYLEKVGIVQIKLFITFIVLLLLSNCF